MAITGVAAKVSLKNDWHCTGVGSFEYTMLLSHNISVFGDSFIWFVGTCAGISGGRVQKSRLKINEYTLTGFIIFWLLIEGSLRIDTLTLSAVLMHEDFMSLNNFCITFCNVNPWVTRGFRHKRAIHVEQKYFASLNQLLNSSIIGYLRRHVTHTSSLTVMTSKQQS